MNAHPMRRLATAVAMVLFCTACGDNSRPAAQETTASEAPAPTAAPETPEHSSDTTVPSGEDAAAGGHQHTHGAATTPVAVTVTSDLAEEVHVHGCDVLHSVSPGRPLNFSFTADVPGVFEVELERSGRLLAQLTVS